MICNLMTQPGETDGLSASKHLEIIRDHMPQVRFDYIIVNDQVISERQATLYQVEGAIQIGVHGSISESVIEGAKIVYGKLLDEGDMVRHDPLKLARSVLDRVMA